ncbi:hypothetical protein N0V93_009604 [Gnomoniopsis smithogilvyi]|uniref:Rpr2-domain-containing protein n=1 Tax=Gnomoniopsis smithogilvyi TaxID=1191159 RepID=A0A9W8YKU0_9PEZI|nr:hypothetical protein N0V93_009604 [Gnomoniopsis smithogilvyi]
MAKKKPGQVPNRHIYTRISFLYQAAACLAPHPTTLTDLATASRHLPQPAHAHVGTGTDGATNMDHHDDCKQVQDSPLVTTNQNMSRKLLTDMRAITQKSVIRASPHVKRSICKYCDSLLIEGQSSSSVVENKSKGGKKPWADVLVIKCHTCGREKRFPVNAPTQKRRQLRQNKKQNVTDLVEPNAASSMDDQST